VVCTSKSNGNFESHFEGLSGAGIYEVGLNGLDLIVNGQTVFTFTEKAIDLTNSSYKPTISKASYQDSFYSDFRYYELEIDGTNYPLTEGLGNTAKSQDKTTTSTIYTSQLTGGHLTQQYNNMETVYLIVNNLNGVIDSNIIPLINARNANLSTFTPIEEGNTWGRLKQSFEESAQEKGRGSEIIRYKNTVEYWVLPFENHPLMEQPNPNDAQVLTKEGYINFGWDIIEEITD
jgi:hypothetical protein